MWCVAWVTCPVLYNTKEPQLSSKCEIKDRSAVPRKQRSVEILAVMAGVNTGKARRYNCEVNSHPRKPWQRRCYLNRVVLYWLPFSITGSVF